MKSLYAFTLVLVLNVTAVAQTLTAKELIEKVKCPNAACVESYLKTKKYPKTEESDGGYVFTSTDTLSAAKYSFVRLDIKDGKTTIQYFLFNKTPFDALVKDFTGRGFSQSLSSDGYNYYSSSTYPKHMLITHFENVSGTTFYLIQIEYQ